jgi:hypothetical protein
MSRHGNLQKLSRQDYEDHWRRAFRELFQNPMMVDSSKHLLSDEFVAKFRVETIKKQ